MAEHYGDIAFQVVLGAGSAALLVLFIAGCMGFLDRG